MRFGNGPVREETEPFQPSDHVVVLMHPETPGKALHQTVSRGAEIVIQKLSVALAGPVQRLGIQQSEV